MEGLAKVSWTNRRLSDANDYFMKVLNEVSDADNLGEGELSRISDYLKNDVNLDLAIHQQPHKNEIVNSFYSPPPGLKEYKDELLQNGGNVIDSFDKAILSYDGQEDGLASIPQNRSIATHELGHAMDYKNLSEDDLKKRRAALKYHDASAAWSFSPSATVAGGGALLSDDDHAPLIGGLAGAAAGAGFGTIPTWKMGNTIRQSEEKANEYGKKIISEVHDNDTAKKLIDDGQKIRDAAINTYKQNNRRVLKNSLIGTGVGTALGVGGGILAQKGLDFLNN